MSNDQLRWHLLQEMSEVLANKIKRYNTVSLFNLLMSGKGPAEAVRLIISQHVRVTKTYGNKYDVYFVRNKEFYIKPIYFQKIALQWAQFLDVYDDDQYEDDVFPEYVRILRQSNNIEKLRFDDSSDCWEEAIAVVDACSNLSSLIGEQTFFSFLFKDAEVDISKLRSMEIKGFKSNDNYELSEGKTIFKALAKHPKRCPLLESLTISTYSLPKILLCLSGNAISTVKSLNLAIKKKDLTMADISCVSFISKAFPNVENVSLTCADLYNEVDTKQIVQKFINFESDFNFKFNYTLKSCKYLKSLKEMDEFQEELETEIAAYGTVKLTVNSKEMWEYTITDSYPKKTVIMRLKIFIAVPSSEDEDDSDSNSTSSLFISDDDVNLDSDQSSVTSGSISNSDSTQTSATFDSNSDSDSIPSIVTSDDNSP